MRNKQSGFFIAGGLEFLVLAALVGGFAATDQQVAQKEKEDAQRTAQVQQASPSANTVQVDVLNR